MIRIIPRLDIKGPNVIKGLSFAINSEKMEIKKIVKKINKLYLALLFFIKFFKRLLFNGLMFSDFQNQF